MSFYLSKNYLITNNNFTDFSSHKLDNQRKNSNNNFLLIIILIITFVLIIFFIASYLFIFNNRKEVNKSENLFLKNRNKLFGNYSEKITNNFSYILEKSKLLLKSDNEKNFLRIIFSENLKYYLIFFKESQDKCKLISPFIVKEYLCNEINIFDEKLVSNNGQIAYIVYKNYLNKDIILNNKNLGSYSDIMKVKFNSTGEKLAYLVSLEKEEKKALFINEKREENNDCQEIIDFFFNPINDVINYLCEENQKRYLIFNGKKKVLSDDPNIEISRIYFTPDYKDYAFEKIYRNDHFSKKRKDPSLPLTTTIWDRYPIVTLNFKNKETKKYAGIHDVVFSSNSRKLAFVGIELNDEGKLFSELVVDGEIIKRVPNQISIELERDISNLSFSPDDRSFVYTIIDKDTGLDELFINGKSCCKYNLISNFIFSPDGKHYAFIAKDYQPDDKIFPVFESMLEERENPFPEKLIVIDGKIFKKSKILSPIKFTKDSRHIFYYELRGTDLWFTVDKLNSQ